MHLSIYPDHKLWYRKKLVELLNQDLNFHEKVSNYATHDYHAFPAKFPPQLPRKFILELTNPKDVVLDPMMGSGTTVLESYLTGRQGVGVDIDPLALKICNAKVTPLDIVQVFDLGNKILHEASFLVANNQIEIKEALMKSWDVETINFINKWFAHETQVELYAILNEVQKIQTKEIKSFFEVVFSAIIITKSGGVSLAYDLAHTRPHLAKAILKRNGDIVYIGNNLEKTSTHRMKLLTKPLRSALEEFDKRFKHNLKNLLKPDSQLISPLLLSADAQYLPLGDDSVDLIITSPPYAVNAIDYMRSHKFSLVWLGHPIGTLGKKRKKYIGSDGLQGVIFEKLPSLTAKVVAELTELDPKRGKALHRYYSEMTCSLREMYRVLKPGKAAIIVVGSSILVGRDTEVHTCLSEIGNTTGFEVPKVGIRTLDRNRRMLPAGSTINLSSQIQKRMHEEYVIGFYKP